LAFVFFDDYSIDAQTCAFLMSKDEVLETDERNTDNHQEHSDNLKTRHSDVVQEEVQNCSEKWRRTPHSLCKPDIHTRLPSQSVGKTD
jgi:hypothetical protein